MLVKHGFNQQIIALKIINILTETGGLYAKKTVA